MWHRASLGEGDSNFTQMKALPFPKGRQKGNSENTLTKIKNLQFCRTTGPISMILGPKHSWVKGILVFTNKKHSIFKIR